MTINEEDCVSEDKCYFCCNQAEYNEITDKSPTPAFNDYQYIGVCKKHMTNHYVS